MLNLEVLGSAAMEFEVAEAVAKMFYSSGRLKPDIRVSVWS